MEKQFDLTIVEFVLSKMSEHPDTGNVITKLLNLVGEHFGVHHIAIVEKNKNMTSFAITYEYCGADCPVKLNHIMYYGEAEWQNSIHLYHDSQLIYFENVKEAEHFPILCNVNLSTGGGFCAARLEHRNERDAALLVKFGAPHQFTEEEKSAFSMMKDMLNLYLLPMRDYEKDRDELNRVRLYDSITGLMKYENFINVAERIYRNDVSTVKYAIVYADISNFKYVNEYYGYTSGDDILRRFEQFYMSNSPAQIIACRLFSDYFIALAKLKPTTTESLILETVEKMNHNFSEMVRQIYPDAKVNVVAGVCLITDKQMGIVTYIDKANIARKQIKKSFADCCMIYDESMEAQAKREMEISSQAEEALFFGEFYFELQPKIDLDTGKVIGAEALARWKKADGAKRYPDQFIPVFEKNGFITKLDFMVYTEVCRYIRKRMIAGEPVVPISLNVSRVHFEKDDFVERVIRLVDNYNVPHEYLEFEITESVFIEQMSTAKSAIESLREAGFQISMDDFGSGYSSLNLLKELEFDVLKLDKGFLAQGTLSRKEAVIISNIIHMAKQMDITVLCEGVETKEQANFLAQADCDLVQGYYYGKPMLVEDFDRLL